MCVKESEAAWNHTVVSQIRAGPGLGGLLVMAPLVSDEHEWYDEEEDIKNTKEMMRNEGKKNNNNLADKWLRTGANIAFDFLPNWTSHPGHHESAEFIILIKLSR